MVIAILAAVSVVAYANIQDRARDSQRINDIKFIERALEIHRLQTGEYPLADSSGQNAGHGGWEVSSGSPETFLQPLVTQGIISQVPVDPVNTGGVDTYYGYHYAYHRYNAGANGCDASRGQYYVLMVRRNRTSISHDASPGFACPGGNDWSSTFYASGRFTN